MSSDFKEHLNQVSKYKLPKFINFKNVSRFLLIWILQYCQYGPTHTSSLPHTVKLFAIHQTSVSKNIV